VTIAELGGFATDWAWSHAVCEHDARVRPAADVAVRDRDAAVGHDAAGDRRRRRPAAAALLAHVDHADAPLRLLIGDDAPVHVGMALEGPRDDYARDARFAWPAP
jgi:hypothetical protein